LGFLAAAVFAGTLKLRRQLFLVPYVLMSGSFVATYLIWSRTSIEDLLLDNLLWGVAAAAFIGALLVKNVLSQASSPRQRGPGFVADVMWSGVVYGTIDSLLLSVLPVMATKEALAGLDLGSDLATDIVVGVSALGASVFVTVAYHAGYPEFRNRSMRFPAMGITLSTVGYLLASNPIASIGSHAAMHVAAVVRGPDKTIQLPPHYDAGASRGHR